MSDIRLLTPDELARLMNVAFERGYQYAQAEIRRALGILK